MPTLISNSNIKVVVNQDSSGVVPTNVSSNRTKLEQLADVINVDKANNAVLSYNSDSKQYEVKSLDINSIQGNLDYGTF